MRRLIILFILIVSFTELKSQEGFLFSQYFVNDVIYNPAISGSKNYNQFTIQTRKEWIGFEGSPFSTNISYHGSLNNRSALGGYVDHNNNSAESRSNLQINYAYHIPFNLEGSHIAFGVGAKAMYYYLDFLPEDLPPQPDPALSSNAYESVSGNASFGIYIYGKKYYFGYSTLNMIQSSFKKEAGDGHSQNIEERIYYGIAGYKWRLNRDWYLEPSVLFRNTDHGDIEYNFSTQVAYSLLQDLYTDQIWAGFSVRSNSSISLSIGTNYNKVQLAYSFDHYFKEISRHQSGTHELTISFFIENSSKY